MAEAIARRVIDEGLLGDEPDLFVASAGVAAGDGSPPAAAAVAALGAMGIEHHGSSKPLTADMVRNADVVFGMTAGHVQIASDLAGGGDDKVIMRLDPHGDIEDPIGMGRPAYDALAERFIELMSGRLKEALQR